MIDPGAYPATSKPRCTSASLVGNEPKEVLETMGSGVSLILVAAGAILTWAVNATVSGLSIHTIGVILMVVGIVGLLLSLMFWSSWGGGGARPRAPKRGAPAPPRDKGGTAPRRARR